MFFRYQNIPGYPDNFPVTVKLNKSLYGLKQAGEVFYQYLRQILEDIGFIRCINDICVFYWKDSSTGHIVVILLYVDDILMTGNCTTKMKDTQAFIESRVTKLKVLGEIKRFIGLDVVRDRKLGTLTLSQQPFCEQLITAESSVQNLKATKVPLNLYKDY